MNAPYSRLYTLLKWAVHSYAIHITFLFIFTLQGCIVLELYGITYGVASGEGSIQFIIQSKTGPARMHKLVEYNHSSVLQGSSFIQLFSQVNLYFQAKN